MCEEELFDEGIATFKSILTLENRVIMKYDRRIITRIYYNLSKSLHEIEQYHDSLFYGKKGITLLLELESFYLLGELYFQVGAAYVGLRKRSEAVSSFDRAKKRIFGEK